MPPSNQGRYWVGCRPNTGFKITAGSSSASLCGAPFFGMVANYRSASFACQRDAFVVASRRGDGASILARTSGAKNRRCSYMAKAPPAEKASKAATEESNPRLDRGLSLGRRRCSAAQSIPDTGVSDTVRLHDRYVATAGSYFCQQGCLRA